MPEGAEFDPSQPGVREGGVPGQPQFGVRAHGAWTPPPATHSQAAAPVRAAREDVFRGAVFALAAVPVGVAAWLLLWSMGWMASIVAFVAAAGAARLYVLGTGGIISRRGVWVVTAVTLGTVAISFWGGMLVDIAKYRAADLRC